MDWQRVKSEDSALWIQERERQKTDNREVWEKKALGTQTDRERKSGRLFPPLSSPSSFKKWNSPLKRKRGGQSFTPIQPGLHGAFSEPTITQIPDTTQSCGQRTSWGPDRAQAWTTSSWPCWEARGLGNRVSGWKWCLFWTENTCGFSASISALCMMPFKSYICYFLFDTGWWFLVYNKSQFHAWKTSLYSILK